MSTIPLRERANGRWKTILPALGIHPRFLTGKNGPCPVCGGRDRWRFDNKRGDGTWICTHCGAGQGIKLAMMFTGITSYREIAERIERIIGEAPREHIRHKQSAESGRAALSALWEDAKPIRAGDPVDLWFHLRGIGMAIYPGCLRVGSRVRHSGPPVSWHPAMLARVTDPAGKPGIIHRTYLTAGGDKAPVEKVRMFCPGNVPAGSAVRLAAPGPILGIAEGIETAFAAMQLFAIPIWAALNDGQLKKFEPPPGTEQLVICGDNDPHGAGQCAAYALAERLGSRLQVEVKIPDFAGLDWNDVLLLRNAAA